MNECMKLESDADRGVGCVFPFCGFLLFWLSKITVCSLHLGGWVPTRSFGYKRSRCQNGLFRMHIDNSDLAIFFFSPVHLLLGVVSCFLTSLKPTSLHFPSTF